MTTADSRFAFDAGAFRSGVRAALPLALPPLPFGLAFGLVVAETPEVGNVAGWASSWIMFAGSAQLVSVQLLADGVSIAVIIASVAMINARHVVYSASVAGRLGALPWRHRAAVAYLLVDQVFAIEEAQPDDLPPAERTWMMLGAGSTFFTLWNVVVAVGLFAGDLLPDDFPTGFVVALLFAGLMVLAVRNRPGVVAAVVGAVVAVAGQDLPSGVGLMAAIIIGSAAGAAAERRLSKRAS